MAGDDFIIWMFPQCTCKRGSVLWLFRTDAKQILDSLTSICALSCTNLPLIGTHTGVFLGNENQTLGLRHPPVEGRGSPQNSRPYCQGLSQVPACAAALCGLHRAQAAPGSPLFSPETWVSA